MQIYWKQRDTLAPVGLADQIPPGSDVGADNAQRKQVNTEAENIVLMLIIWDASQHRLGGKYTPRAEFFPSVNAGSSARIRKCNQRLGSRRAKTKFQPDSCGNLEPFQPRWATKRSVGGRQPGTFLLCGAELCLGRAGTHPRTLDHDLLPRDARLVFQFTLHGQERKADQYTAQPSTYLRIGRRRQTRHLRGVGVAVAAAHRDGVHHRAGFAL